MSDIANILSDHYDKELLSWFENGVPTGEFDADGKEIIRRIGPAEMKIVGSRLKEGGLLDADARSSVAEALDKIRNGELPPLSDDDDPATG